MASPVEFQERNPKAARPISLVQSLIFMVDSFMVVNMIQAPRAYVLTGLCFGISSLVAYMPSNTLSSNALTCVLQTY